MCAALRLRCWPSLSIIYFSARGAGGIYSGHDRHRHGLRTGAAGALAAAQSADPQTRRGRRYCCCSVRCWAWASNSLQPQVLHVLDVVPRATAKFSEAMRASARNHNGALQKLNRAATEIERAAVVANTPTATPGAPVARAAEPPAEPPINVRDYIMMGTANAVAAVGQLVVVLSLAYLPADLGRQLSLRAAERLRPQPRQEERRHCASWREIMVQIQRYLATTGRHQRSAGRGGRNRLRGAGPGERHASGPAAALCCT